MEDHGGSPRLDDIKQDFGPKVARLVAGLTDSFAEDSNNKKPWPQRKKAYIRRLRRESADVQLISAADKLYNARAILEDYRDRRVGAKTWERFKRSRNDQLWYFNAVLRVFNTSGGGRIVEELERVLAELTRISAHEVQ